MILRLTCNTCKSEVDVSLYYTDYYIETNSYHSFSEREYVATARGKAICPCCGKELYADFRHTLSQDEIIELAQKGRTIVL